MQQRYHTPSGRTRICLLGNLAEPEQGTATWVQTHSIQVREPYPHLSYQATPATSGTPRCWEDSHDYKYSGMSNLFLKLTSGPFVSIYTVSLAIQVTSSSFIVGFATVQGHFLLFLSKAVPKYNFELYAQISAFRNLLNSDSSSAKHTLKAFSTDGLGKGGGTYKPHCSEAVPTGADHQC